MSCSSSEPTSRETEASAGKPGPAKISESYNSTYPQREISEELEEARQSLVRILSTAFYNNYIFEEKFVTLSDITTNNPKDISTQYFSSEESTAGTAILLQKNRDDVLLITCDHVVSSPDTVVTYYEGDDVPERTFVKSISIKQRQNNLTFSAQRLHSFNVIASDPRTDLALLSSSLRDQGQLSQQTLDITLGNSDRLRMGSMLYILGFPRGYPMVTRGLASLSENRSSYYFVTDAVFNPGVSGGLVLASRNDFRSFEWVGMARSASASKENLLVPRPDSGRYSQAAKPYTGTPFVQRKTRISYGITQTIPINTIREFLRESREAIRENGFSYNIP